MRFGRRYALVKQVTREGPLEVWVRIGAYYYFLTQSFFLGGTSPQRTRSVGRGRSKYPSYHPPTPYTFSPPLKGGERARFLAERYGGRAAYTICNQKPSE